MKAKGVGELGLCATREPRRKASTAAILWEHETGCVHV